MSEATETSTPVAPTDAEQADIKAALGDLSDAPDAEPETPAEETPEETPEEAPAEPEETPSEPADEVEEEPAKPKRPETPPAPQPDPRAESDARKRELDAQITALRAKKKTDAWDPIDDGGVLMDLTLERQDILDTRQEHIERREQARQQQDQAETYWRKDFPKQHPGVDAEEARSKLVALVSAYEKRGFSQAAAEAAGTGAWESWIETAKGAKPPKAAAAAPPPPAKPPVKPAAVAPVTKGAARITPQTNTSTPPPPQPRTVSEQIKAGHFGKIGEI